MVLIAWRGRYEGHASGADQTYEVEVKRVDTNQTMKFTVRELDTIEMVKGRIQHQWEIEIDRQHLVFNSGFLENTSTLADCQVIQGSQLYLAVKGEMPSDFKTSITGLDGRECTVEVNASDTVFMFRSKIEDKLVNTSDTVVPRLIFEGTGSVNTLLAPDRALNWRVSFLRDEENMSTKLQISFESDSRMMEIEGSKTILEVMSQIQDQEGIPADQLPRIFSLWSCRRPRTTTPVRGAKKKKKKEPPDGEAAGGGSSNKRRRSGEANAVGEAAQKKNETKKKKKPLKIGGKRGVEAQPAARSAAVSELEDSMLGLAVVSPPPPHGTTHVTFPPPVGVVAWLPTKAPAAPPPPASGSVVVVTRPTADFSVSPNCEGRLPAVRKLPNSDGRQVAPHLGSSARAR